MKEFIKRFKFSLATNIIIGMVLGIIVGIFFGEACSGLKVIGDGFIQLLQMTVLPYIVVSLIFGIGGLNYKNAKLLAVKGGLLMIVYWAIAFIVIIALPMIFPNFEQASFFSTSMVAKPPEVDYLSLYIPSNPFRSLAENLVPAVVLFSLCVGIAMIGMKDKSSLMKVLNEAKEALTIVTHFIIKLTPIGVFAISASAAGTMTIDEFGRLQVYLTAYLIGTLIVTFIILPALVAMLTSFSYRRVLSVSRDALVASFTTGNLFVVLPIIVGNSRTLFEESKLRTDETDAYTDVIIPVTFNFPNIGKLLFLVFILFGAWFTGSSLSVTQYPDFIVSGLLSFFGSTDVALPFLLNHFRLPADLFQLYMVSGIVIGKFATMIAAMNLLTFTLICTYSLTNQIKLNAARILTLIVVSGGVSIVILIAGKISLAYLVKNEFTEAEMLSSMKIDNPVKAKVETKVPEPNFWEKLTGPDLVKNRLEQIRKRGVLRVGYNLRSLPFAFLNKKGDLVGFDVQMAHHLARDLGCTLEFKPFEYSDIPKALNYDLVDISMSSISVNSERIQEIGFTRPYLELSLGLVVKGYEKERYDTKNELKAFGKKLKIAVLKGSAYKQIFSEQFPKAIMIDVESQEEFFDGKTDADALLTSAEQGSAWTLIHPQYKVVIPRPGIMKSVIAYAFAKGDPEFLLYLNHWLEMRKINGDFKKEYSYWILGVDPTAKKPRWCIARDVLHLMD